MSAMLILKLRDRRKRGNDMYRRFLENEQMNFQLNRVAIYGKSCVDLDEVIPLLPRMKDMNGWIEAWLELADKAYKEQRFSQATYYYRMAEFFMKDSAPNKLWCYKKFRECFDCTHKNDHVERFEVPFGGTYLPAIRIKAENEIGTLLIHGGYDSFIEEFYPQVTSYVKLGFSLILYEGPGQGQARKNGLYFNHEWEKPTSAVLDYFNLDNVAIMGISWGGYLAPRAAAFDKRITNVICYDICYWGLEALLCHLPDEASNKLQMLLYTQQKDIINKILAKNMSEDIHMDWQISHGMYITGTDTPYDYLKNIEKHKMSDIMPRITQNVLLLAGEEDMYVPVKRIEDIKRGLVNAKSVTSHVFTKKTGGEKHCQVGEIQLAEREIVKFLKTVYNIK